MAEEMEVRITVKMLKDGKAQIGMYDPISCRHSFTGLTAGPGQEKIDAQILQLKGQLQRAGHRVTVVFP